MCDAITAVWMLLWKAATIRMANACSAVSQPPLAAAESALLAQWAGRRRGLSRLFALPAKRLRDAVEIVQAVVFHHDPAGMLRPSR